MAGRHVVCFRCKRGGTASANNPAYCDDCERAVRHAHETRHLCPKCGAEGVDRGLVHVSLVGGGGGFTEQAYCPRCREWYAIR